MRFYISTGVAPVNPDSLASCSSSELRPRTRGSTGPWEAFDGVIDSGPAITSNANPMRLDIFARAPDNQLEHWSANAGWENLGNEFVGQPAATSWGPGRLDVFVVNISGALWWWWSES
jgi:hypothetical protein